MRGKISRKRKVIITGIALMAIFGATMFAVGGAQNEDVSADVATVTVDGKEITVDKDGNEVKVKDGKVEVVEENAVSKEEATKAVKESNKNSSSFSNKDSRSTKPSNSNSSNSSGTTKPTEPTKPSHTHDWVAVYATKQVQVGTERQWVKSIIVCNCGARDIDFAHTDAHIDAGEPSNTSTEEVYETVPVYESQKYIDYYKCSCGATK